MLAVMFIYRILYIIRYIYIDVRHTVFFYNYKFRERDDVGACCNFCLGVDCRPNTVPVEQIVCIFGVKSKIQDGGHFPR